MPANTDVKPVVRVLSGQLTDLDIQMVSPRPRPLSISIRPAWRWEPLLHATVCYSHSYEHQCLCSAPQKLSEGSAAVQQEGNAASSSQQAASTWNKAGTFEERDVTEWAKQRLQDMVVGTSSGAAVVTKCRSIIGHANIWCVIMSLIAFEAITAWPRGPLSTFAAVIKVLISQAQQFVRSTGHACLAASSTAGVSGGNRSTPCACTCVAPAIARQQVGPCCLL